MHNTQQSVAAGESVQVGVYPTAVKPARMVCQDAECRAHFSMAAIPYSRENDSGEAAGNLPFLPASSDASIE
jgi:hypothetical protein